MAEIDEEFEQQLRATLSRQADRASMPAGITQRTTIATSRRRTRARMATGAALVSAAAVAVGATVLIGQPTGADGPIAGVPSGPTTAPDSSAPDPATTSWRTELWHGIAVDVPADWGYQWPLMPEGGAITTEHMSHCTDSFGPDGEPASSLPGWVARGLTVGADYCSISNKDLDAYLTQAPFVAFETHYPAGTRSVGSGYAIQTTVVDGMSVSVGSDDPELRSKIVDSIRPSKTCPDLTTMPEPTATWSNDPADFSHASYCVYDGSQWAGWIASAGGPLDLERVRDAWQAEQDAPSGPPVSEPSGSQAFIMVSIGPKAGRQEVAFRIDLDNAGVSVSSPDGVKRVQLTSDALESISTGAMRLTTTFKVATPWLQEFTLGDISGNRS